jgi:sugar lactone lactonase YvrE
VEQVRCVLDCKALVGESPRWNPVDQALWWVDIYEPSLNRFDPVSGKARKYAMPEHIGCFSFTRSGRIIAGMKSGIAFIDLDPTVKIERVFDLNAHQSGYRFNDGRCDPGGVSGLAVSWKGWSAGSARYTGSIGRAAARG